MWAAVGVGVGVWGRELAVAPQITVSENPVL